MHRLSRVVAAACAFAAVLPSTAVAEKFTKTSLTIPVQVGANDDVRCRVVANLFKPQSATKDTPQPAIMGTNGFGGSRFDLDSIAAAYASRGYVFLAYSGLGFGGSGCRITLDDPDFDGKAGSQLVSFLGGSKAAADGTKVDYVLKDAKDHDGQPRDDDPRVGFTGGSYGGGNQFAVASVDPRVDALNPQITWNDLSYSLVPNNTDLRRGVTYATGGVAKLDWPTLFSVTGIARGLQQLIFDRDLTHLGSCPNFADQVCPGLVNAAIRGYADQATLGFLRHASVGSYVDRIKVPTFLTQGQSDTLFNLQEAVATWRSLRAQGTPTKLLWRSSGHSGGGLGTSEANSKRIETAYETRMQLEWFDWYLRGAGDPPTLDFSFLADWRPYKGDAAPAVGSAPSYPVGQEQQFFLSGSGGLLADERQVVAGSAPMLALPQAGVVDSGGAFNDVLDLGDREGLGTSVAFTSAPLTDDLDVVGIPQVTFRVSAPVHAATQAGDDAAKLVLFAKLYDVGPDGTQLLPRSQLSAARIKDVTKPVTIQLPGVAHRWGKGHRLRLVLATSNLTNRGNTVPGPVTIETDPSAPSVLTVDRLGAQTGPDGSGPSGTTPYAASDKAPKPLPAGTGGPRTAQAAGLPSAKRCVSRRTLRITLRRPKGDRVRSATVSVNGRRRTTLRGRRTVAPVSLKGLPKGTYRVAITIRTAKGKVLRQARTYRTCTTRRSG
ncbi:CocE/NonD family hydrolase [Conexibacter sp. SYSU D00693]|uniref:CocE/NonD family hydrolase n=1 Tax=Conexibacter sp. SYSU D00693 TaxID=2812560 RepID=UPI00196B21AE|nr:CocE/NonD family hydrolase [Conexibacter sp. SYSU D00693]